MFGSVNINKHNGTWCIRTAQLHQLLYFVLWILVPVSGSSLNSTGLPPLTGTGTRTQRLFLNWEVYYSSLVFESLQWHIPITSNLRTFWKLQVVRRFTIVGKRLKSSKYSVVDYGLNHFLKRDPCPCRAVEE